MAKVRTKKVSLEKTIKVVEQDLRNEQEKDSCCWDSVRRCNGK